MTNGATALMLAAKNGHFKVVRLLQERRSLLLERSNRQWDNCLDECSVQ